MRKPAAGQLRAALPELYAAGGSDAVASLARDRASGALSQPPGALGCIRDGGGLGCASARHLIDRSEFVLSPDGRNAYVTSDTDAVAVYRRALITLAASEEPGAPWTSLVTHHAARPQTEVGRSRSTPACH